MPLPASRRGSLRQSCTAVLKVERTCRLHWQRCSLLLPMAGGSC